MKIADVLALAQRLAQGGVLTAQQLVDHDVPPAVLRALRTRWPSPVRGIFLAPGVTITPVVKGRVGLAVAGDGSVVSGWLAAHLLELPWVPELPRITVLVDPSRAPRSRGWVRVRRSQTARQLRTVNVEGLVIADVPWAVIDTAREISMRRDCGDLAKLQDVRGVVLGAILTERCTAGELLEVLGAGETRHSALARRACRDAERGALSPPEAEMVDDALAFGVPFYANVEVWIKGVFVGLVDGWLIGVGVGWECDSKQEHADQERLDGTLSRSERFRVNGAHLAHVSPQRFRRERGSWWEREVFAEVRRRLAKGLGDPPGLELRSPRGPLLYAPTSSPPYPIPDLSRCVLAVEPDAAAA